VRVIAGSLKGRRLNAPDWDGLRPTSDKLRETLFNVLAPRIGGARVIDGYAGTGALGIEALSRGAREVTFIERDARAQTLIAENLKRCGVASGYTMVRSDAIRALESLTDAGRFDIILLDPPYAIGDDEIAHALAAAAPLLAAHGVMVLEHGRRTAAPAVDGLVRIRDVASGDSTLTLYAARIESD
jgi:16S rRNA (guanine(966)-N(2))-methyltransferase RsmD